MDTYDAVAIYRYWKNSANTQYFMLNAAKHLFQILRFVQNDGQ